MRPEEEERGFALAAVDAPLAIVEWDAEHRIRHWSADAERLFGWSAADVVDRPIGELPWVHEEDREPLLQLARQLAEGETSCISLHRVYRKDGALLHCTWHHTPLRGDGGRLRAVHSLVIDRTREVGALAALQASEERFRLATRAMQGIVYDWSIETGYVRRSVGVRTLLGYEPGEIPDTLEGWRSLIHPEDRERIDREYAAATVAQAPVLGAEYRARHRDGRWVWLWDHSLIRYDEHGAPVHLIGCTVSIDQRKRSEQRARFLVRLADATRGLEDPDAIVATCTALLREHLEVDGCAYAEMEADGEHFRILGMDPPPALPLLARRHALGDLHPAVRAQLRAGAALVVDDVDVLFPGPSPGPFRRAGVRAGVATPLVKEGRLVASIALLVRSPRRWQEDEVELVRIVTNRCWESIERVRIHQRLRASEERFRRVVESNMIGIAFWDEKGPILDANDALLEMAGRTREELEAGLLDWREMVAPEQLPRHERGLAEIRVNGRSSAIESELVRPDGTRVPILCAGSSLGSDPTTGVTWLLDISRQRRAQEERDELLRVAQRARAEAEAASQAKDEFLAMLGHELRNPLASVRNAIAGAQLDPSLAPRALEIAERATGQLVRLVDDLLDVARITRGRIKLRRERVAVGELVERALETTRPLAEGRRHPIEVEIEAGPLHVLADPTRIEQVLVNLLSNAIKYGGANARIRVSAAREGDEAVLRVRDDGIGIPPDVLPRVFDLFSQADRSLDRTEGGLGIGLTLVKRLVELHGGRVEAHSPGRGQGAEFVVRLPRVPSPASGAGRRRADAATRSGGARILLVEDNRDAADSLAMVLEIKGYTVEVAHDGPAALAAARREAPDVMLVDIGLPGMNGYELAEHLRGDARLGDIALVALTGYGAEEDRRRALEAGFDAHLVKPIDFAALRRVLEGLTQRR